MVLHKQIISCAGVSTKCPSTVRAFFLTIRPSLNFFGKKVSFMEREKLYAAVKASVESRRAGLCAMADQVLRRRMAIIIE